MNAATLFTTLQNSDLIIQLSPKDLHEYYELMSLDISEVSQSTAVIRFPGAQLIPPPGGPTFGTTPGIVKSSLASWLTLGHFLPCPWNQSFLQEFLITFCRTSYLETLTWVLWRLIGSGLILMCRFFSFPVERTRK